MLVRLKKRGEWPDLSHSGLFGPSRLNDPAFVLSHFGTTDAHGLTLDVELVGCHWPCGGEVLDVVDKRVADVIQARICSHYLIDDLDAYESDHDDETAEIGDLAKVVRVLVSQEVPSHAE